MTTDEIRKRYLGFFAARGHAIVPSSSLVPENDASTLFTGSGMQPMVPYLLGAPHPLGTRIADSQKSFRAQDIEEVGDNRHTTFFEMLGNWSLGDYFKAEQIPWMFEFLTQELGLDPSRIYVTCFRGNAEVPCDEESAGIWQKLFSAKGIEAPVIDFSERDGMQGGRIFYYNENKNWWSRSGVPGNMPLGEPGGPDTEMFWDFGASLGLHENSLWKNEPCHVNCDCGRFMEIGNNVFMEYVKTEKGFEKLVQRNVDFGGGLERMAAAVRDDPDMFRIDLLWVLVEHLQEASGKQYGRAPEVTRQMRIVADHIRGSVFLVVDGVLPSNKDRGYVLRRLLRRAMVAMRLLGSNADWVPGAVAAVINTYKDAYTELRINSAQITKVIEEEKNKFSKTLDRGISELEKYYTKIFGFKPGTLERRGGGTSGNVLSGIKGAAIFDIYQSYGLPIEVSQEIMKKWGLRFDDKTMEEAMIAFKKHQDLSKTASAGDFKGGLANHSDMVVRYHTATHLLQKALRQVLGDNVWQKGSNITSERTRFDFTFDRKMTEEEKQQVESLVNGWIERDLPVKREMLPLEEARARGAIGLFGEKYPETVSVYGVSDPVSGETISLEFCGGPHVEHTGLIGRVRIQKEEAISSGVRRVKAVIE